MVRRQLRKLVKRAPLLRLRMHDVATHARLGEAPGTLIAVPGAIDPVVTAIAYDESELWEGTIEDLDRLEELREGWSSIWVNVDGLGDIEILKRIAAQFGLHPLAMEDALDANQRPKFEEYAEHIHLSARMASAPEEGDLEQISIFAGPGWVVTLQQRDGDCFDALRRRIRSGAGRVRTSTSDYLAYAQLDSIIDAYFPMLDAYSERVESLEERLFEGAPPETLPMIYELRRDLLALRRAVWPLRDALGQLIRSDSTFFHDDTRVYARDGYDHLIQIVDLIETYREIGSSLMELYLSSVSHKMNEVMKVLTVISTVFIPLGFLAGLYGMNFERMPELRHPYGYPILLAVMLTLAISMLAWFRRRGWF